MKAYLIAIFLLLSFILILPLLLSANNGNDILIDEKVIQELEYSEFVPVIVTLKDTTNISDSAPDEDYFRRAKIYGEEQDEILNTLTEEDFKLKFTYTIINGFAGNLSKQGLNKLKQYNNVLRVNKDRKAHAHLDVSRPLIDADVMENSFGYTGKGQVVCVIDTGINYSHPNLGGCTKAQFTSGTCSKVIGGWDFANNDNDPGDDAGHGTHVAGIIASKNYTIVGDSNRGVAPNAKLIAMKVLDEYGGGDASTVIKGINWCRDNRTKYNITIISMSLGIDNYPIFCDWVDEGIAANRAVAAGIFVVASTGNDGSVTHIGSPACASNVTSVGASYDEDIGSHTRMYVCTDSTTYADKIACWSNRNNLTDIFAPGAAINSTVPLGTCPLCSSTFFRVVNGTSMAAPHVSGTAALLLEYRKGIKPYQMRKLLNKSSMLIGSVVYDPAPETKSYYPRVDADSALYWLAGVPITVRNDSNQAVAKLDDDGNIAVTNTLYTGYTSTPPDLIWKIVSDAGLFLMGIDIYGNIYIRGSLYENQATVSNPAGNDFLLYRTIPMITERSARLDNSGNLYLRDFLFENSNPEK